MRSFAPRQMRTFTPDGSRLDDMKSTLELAIAASSPEVMLALLLEAWRERRLARTADLVAIAARRLPSLAPPKAKNAAEAQAYWLDVAARHDARDLDWLCKTITTSRRDHSMARVEALANWPPDPRAALGLLALVRERPFTSEPNRPFWTLVFRVLARVADESLVPAIASVRPAALVSNFEAYIESKLRALETTIERRPRLETPTARELELLDAIAAALAVPGEAEAQKTEADFLAEIWANPKDDGPREVFADWLLERNDPRGELIALQMTRTRGGATRESLKREQKLLAEHARTWMGPLEPAVQAKAYRFERGFLYACKVDWRRMLTTPGLVNHPAWATVREYDLEPAGELACDAWLDHMIALGAKRR